MNPIQVQAEINIEYAREALADDIRSASELFLGDIVEQATYIDRLQNIVRFFELGTHQLTIDEQKLILDLNAQATERMEDMAE